MIHIIWRTCCVVVVAVAAVVLSVVFHANALAKQACDSEHNKITHRCSNAVRFFSSPYTCFMHVIRRDSFNTINCSCLPVHCTVVYVCTAHTDGVIIIIVIIIICNNNNRAPRTPKRRNRRRARCKFCYRTHNPFDRKLINRENNNVPEMRCKLSKYVASYTTTWQHNFFFHFLFSAHLL